jgi:hypothetical protein
MATGGLASLGKKQTLKTRMVHGDTSLYYFHEHPMGAGNGFWGVRFKEESGRGSSAVRASPP